MDALLFCFVGVVGWRLHPKNGKETLTDDELKQSMELALRMVAIYEEVVCRGL